MLQSFVHLQGPGELLRLKTKACPQELGIHMQRDNLYTIVLNKNNSHKGSADKVLIIGLNMK